ncbi:MAG: zinc ABC transporter substrate-binding protein [Anaerolineales bacterium]|nr:zinc ABC transporter substrate-binding protein [Anaerolineales bacterium]
MRLHRHRNIFLYYLSIALILFLPACAHQNASLSGREINIVATTTIVGDVVQNVAGEWASVHILLPPGTDPHHFDPAPKDLALLQDAQVIFANGAGLEEFLEPLIESAGGEQKIIHLSERGILLDGQHDEAEIEHDESVDEHTREGDDPHTWTDPNNVIQWVALIADTLSELDPAHAQNYQDNAADYQNELIELDTWIVAQVAQIAPENREIVTDHKVFGYFANRYGFEQIGAIIPAYSTLAEPSAQELAALEDAILSLGVQAVFVGNTVNPSLAQRLADDTGIRLVYIYTGSLTTDGGEADTYLDYMRYNVSAIVEGLK